MHLIYKRRNTERKRSSVIILLLKNKLFMKKMDGKCLALMLFSSWLRVFFLMIYAMNV